MPSLNLVCRLAAAALSAAFAFPLAQLALPVMPALSAEAPAPACNDKDNLARLRSPLSRVARRLAAGRPVTIMALGSSSTAGAGASSPAAAYPSRLEAELKTRFPDLAITVTNRGVNGEEVADMLARFDQAAATDKPDLVLWQVGTNAVLRDTPLGTVDRTIKDGLARMKAIGADVVLIDPQFAPTVIVKSDAVDMVHLVAADATARGVDLFPRFAVMRSWHEKEGVPFDTFMSPDQLHMNDWGYACLAKLLGRAIAEAATRPIASARVNKP
jgi:lysophospholipase L1-like esterase